MMTDKRRLTARAFGLSVLVGAFAGMSLQSLVLLLLQPALISFSELWAIPVILFGYGLFAVPFVALGLLIFGLPATWLFSYKAGSWWLCIVAVIWGAVAGKLTFYAIDQLIFLGFYRLGELAWVDLGVLYGVPTALAWWALQRGELAHRYGDKVVVSGISASLRQCRIADTAESSQLVPAP
ncbi:hypothetical protein M2341_001799 [Sphingobium sp. B7D2B]|uniref:hypothetical protein n=1 Tax=Sphingobium sp. B7D2B TaxID=2940583 RepID=UPI002224DA58|nr:hypothetical protein [Sphingobium sp. B7D2B]MCW2366352.1 hypothetical protein [Sphingobium sp. B7D2B]